MEDVIQRLVNRDGIDPDLEEQLRIYELVLQHEDEGADGAILSGTVDNIRLIRIFERFRDMSGVSNLSSEI